MKTIRRLIYGEILMTTGFVLLAFLALFFFFDFVEELPSLGRVSRLEPGVSYELRHALLYVGLLIPNRIYELLPISVLIGSVAVMARLAKGSEYTILRTSGLGPWRALRTLLGLGVVFVAITFRRGRLRGPTCGQDRPTAQGPLPGPHQPGANRRLVEGTPTRETTTRSMWGRYRPQVASVRYAFLNSTTKGC